MQTVQNADTNKIKVFEEKGLKQLWNYVATTEGLYLFYGCESYCAGIMLLVFKIQQSVGDFVSVDFGYFK